uniref:Reverse transcriptase zinc-binding domain-containing protein n=1 Tax=Cannabis sativa TaxID=3483 RepID=A0A803P9M0_CANSA
MLGYRVFGDGSGASDARADEFKAMVVEVMVLAGIFNIGEFVPALEWLDLQGVAAKMKKLHKRFDTFLGGIIEEHKTKIAQNKQHTHDLLTTLISLNENSEDESQKLTDTEIKALLLNMFTAGTDTSSSTVEWAIAELIRHPKIMAHVQEELDHVVGRDRLVSDADLTQLTYLQAVIKEIFRLHPSTPLSLPRMASQDCEINGYHIPKGSTLLVNVWAIARDPEQWTDPLEFRPERFLPGGEKAHVDIKGNDFEVIPFGAGRRICVGMTMGLRMVKLLTATLVHAFNMKLPNELLPEKLNMDEAYGLTLQRAAPLIIEPQPRLAQHVIVTTNNPGLLNQNVLALFSTDSLCWDHDLVIDMFNPRDAALILGLPLSHTLDDDCWYWNGESNGSFSVSSAYSLLQQSKSSRPVPNNFGFWKELWQLKIPPKVKNTLWRALTNCLPTCLNLVTKHVNVSTLCPMCATQPENTSHALVECSLATACWQHLGVHRPTPPGTFASWFELTFTSSATEDMCKIAMVC